MSGSLREVLSMSCLNRRNINGVVEQVLENPGRFPELYALTCDEEDKTAHHAWWACEKVSYQLPELFTGKREELMQLATEITHEGMRRSLLNILLYLPDAEEKTDVPFLNFCLDEMFDPKHPPAVQSLLLKLAYRFCIREPELRQEFSALLEYAELEYYSPAVTSTVRNIQKAEKRYAASLLRGNSGDSGRTKNGTAKPLIFKRQNHV